MNERGRSEATEPTGRAAVLVAAALAVAYAAGTALAPLLEARGIAGGGLLRLLYAPICHQDPARCFELAGLVLGACSRCVGFYAGGALGLLSFALVGGDLRLRPVWFGLAVTPTLWDVAAGWTGLPSLGTAARFWLALPTGLVIGVYLAVAVADLAAMADLFRAFGKRP